MGTENLHVEFEDIGIFRVNETHRFEALDDRAFIDYVNKTVGKLDLAWIVVGKLAQLHMTEAQTFSMARKLQELGFKRVIMQNASSQDQIFIRHDLHK